MSAALDAKKVVAILTQSRARAARTCARLHQFRYVDGWSPVETAEDLDFGTRIHRALAAWWLHPVSAEWSVDARLAFALSHLDGMEPFARCRAEAMVRGYHVRWGEEPLMAVSVEQSFETALVNPDSGSPSPLWRIAGKLDVVVRDLITGKLVLMEHKTSSEDISPGSNYTRKLRLDTQISMYFDGAASLGYQVESCIYDVLGKLAIRPKKATPEAERKYTAKTGALYANQRANDETPEEYLVRCVEAICAEPERYFARIDVVRLDEELIDSRRDIWQLAQRLREDERLSRAPRNPDACFRGSKPCPFFDVCTGAAALDDPSRFTRRTDVHPELAPETSTNPGESTKEVQ